MRRTYGLKSASTANRVASLILLLSLTLIFVVPVSVCAKSMTLISTPEGLIHALSDAQSGDIIYVDDIDFTPGDGILNKLMRISLGKSVTIKSGKKGARAVFTNGSFNLQGSKTASERLICRFEDIVFDGGIEGAALTIRDWELPYNDNLGEYTSDEPLKAQYAFSFRGNADVSFYGCDFRNYMFSEGGVMRCYYGDYSVDANLQAKLGDYTGCTLNISLDKCNLTDNSAYYGGGAVYLDGFRGNVTFTATDTSFSGNRCTSGEYATGGGAIHASGAKVTLSGCTVRDNTANYMYTDILPDTDGTQGGAICCAEGELILSDCLIAGNTASVGGGIALINAKSTIDGCIIAGNCADFKALNPYGLTGPWSNMGLGGALYYSSVNASPVTIVNTSIYGNSAKTAYAGVYPFYNNDYAAALPHGFGNITFLFSSYAQNTCMTEYDYSAGLSEWYQVPGDVWEIPYVEAYGCLITDRTFDSDFQRYSVPGENNLYNYFASDARAEADGLKAPASSEQDYCHYISASPDGIEWSVPSSFTGKVLDGRYNGALTNVHVGSNYTSALYRAKNAAHTTIVIIIIAVAALLSAVVVVTHCLRRRRAFRIGNVGFSDGVRESEAVPAQASPAVPVFVSRYTYEQIDTVLAAIPESSLLTAREREVIREILTGKQQSEIARELGIEVTTVKDFNRKIYDKFDVPNKKKLIEKVGDFYLKQ